jgi:hypothetical protein
MIRANAAFIHRRPIPTIWAADIWMASHHFGQNLHLVRNEGNTILINNKLSALKGSRRFSPMKKKGQPNSAAQRLLVFFDS